MALRLDDLGLTQGDFALRADLRVETGAQVAVIGPSGAGKSTLLMLIAGYLAPDSGQVLWNGTALNALPPGKRPISMLFQDNNLFPHLTVAQNVGLGRNSSLRLSREDHKQVSAALERVGLSGYEARRPSELSGGQQSRVALARTLVQRRPLLLLDEPFSALGPAMRMDMLDLVADLTGETGATLLMVSHAPEDARRIAAQTIVVIDGAVRSPQDTAKVLDTPDPALRAYLGSAG